MRSFPIRSLSILLLLVTVVPGAGVFADEGSSPEQQVLVSIRVGQIEGDSRKQLKEYELIAVSHARPAELVIGGRVPIPTTSFKTGGKPGEPVPITSYTYQNVGFSAKVEARVLDGRIWLEAELEDSHLPDNIPPGARPIISTHQQRVELFLADGVPMQFTRADDPGLGDVYYEVEARVLN